MAHLTTRKKMILGAIASIVVLLGSIIFSHTTNATHDGGSDLHGCSTSILGLPVWYKYLPIDEGCNVVETAVDDPATPTIDESGTGATTENVFWLVGAAIVEMLLRVATYVAVVYVFWGGFMIMTSTGTPESVAKGRDKIINGIIGLIIAVMAASVVSYITVELTKGGSTTGLGLPDLTGDEGAGALAFVLNLVYRLAAGITVIFVSISGFNFVTSGGDPQRVAKARNSIIYAIVGLIIALLAVAIIAAVGDRL